MRMRLAWLVAFAVTTVALSGCFDERKPELTVFRVDELKHWFEDERLVVNVTITNQVNFTPRGIFPELEAGIREWEAKPGSHDPGEETRQEGLSTWFHLNFMPPGAGPFDEERERWVFEEFIQDSADITAIAHEGPMLIPPGTSVTREFEFPLKNIYYGNQGHYSIEIFYTGMFPDGYYEEYRTRIQDSFQGGCFNFDTPEFYGVVQGGLDCHYWDCTGLRSESEYPKFREMGKVKAEYLPDCSATDAIGPYYD